MALQPLFIRGWKQLRAYDFLLDILYLVRLFRNEIESFQIN